MMTRLLDSHGLSIPAPDDLLLAVSLGFVPGYSLIQLSGRNTSVGVGGIGVGNEDIWEGTNANRVLPSSAGVVSVVSSDTGDTAAGVGARTVLVTGLDANLLEQTELVVMNGTSAVTTSASFLRVNRIDVATAGSLERNAGNITASIGGEEQARMLGDASASLQMLWTVPANKTYVVASFKVNTSYPGSATQDVTILVQSRANGGSVWNTHLKTEVQDEYDVEPYLVIPSGRDIRMIGFTDNATAFVNGAMLLVDIDNELVPGVTSAS